MPTTACPFCFSDIDSSRLAYQCSGRGTKVCEKVEDEAWHKVTGGTRMTSPTFRPEPGKPTLCPHCGSEAKRRACPRCHTALPSEFVGAKSPLIGLVGSKGSGKTVLMTVLVKHLREIVARRYDADIMMITDSPDGQRGISAYQANRETPLYTRRELPVGTSRLGSSGREHAAPVVLRWRQATAGRFVTSHRSTLLSLVDSAGEDLNNVDDVFTLHYLKASGSLIVAMDPFALPGARARLSLPEAATQVADEVPLNVLRSISEMLRTEHGVNWRTKRITIPVAVVFTKMDAFYQGLLDDDQMTPLLADTPDIPSYDESDGLTVHEIMKSLLEQWHADEIDRFMRLTFSDYRYFAVSALGAEPDYATGQVAAGGVQPHRIADPVLWLLAKTGTVPVSRKGTVAAT